MKALCTGRTRSPPMAAAASSTAPAAAHVQRRRRPPIRTAIQPRARLRASSRSLRRRRRARAPALERVAASSAVMASWRRSSSATRDCRAARSPCHWRCSSWYWRRHSCSSLPGASSLQRLLALVLPSPCNRLLGASSLQGLLALAPRSPFSAAPKISSSSLRGHSARDRLAPSDGGAAPSKPGGVEAAVLWLSEGGEGMSSRMEWCTSALEFWRVALTGLPHPSPVTPGRQQAFCSWGACPAPNAGRSCCSGASELG
mmetsp:Transcript_132370/g.411489  ORF Transcript_132370/g.411489 Transcript_132370/m.411489 type:complete len:258 (-) Transcript_132370:208-981(-)